MADRVGRLRRCKVIAIALVVCLGGTARLGAQEGPSKMRRGDRVEIGGPAAVPLAAAPTAPMSGIANGTPIDVEQMLSPAGMSSTLKVMLLLTVITLAPSILIMTTCFIRFVIVLSLLRQALGTQQLPPNQVIVSLCLFLTFLVMAPVWRQAYDQGIRPYTAPVAGQNALSLEEAYHRTAQPLRKFMIEQIQRTDNMDAVMTFLEFQQPRSDEKVNLPRNLEEVDTVVLLPAFMMSELKTSFIIGFQIYLPFLIIDMVISTVLISMGMMMLPPVLVSLPFKLLLFVLIDGWTLTVGMLLESVRTVSP
jgi:flagellar biosynthetic protein FliP